MGSSEGARGPWGKVYCRGRSPLTPALFGLWLPPACVSCGVLGRSQHFGYKALLMSYRYFRGTFRPKSCWTGRRHVFSCLPPEWGQPTEPAFDCTDAFPVGKNLGRERQTCRCRSRWVSGPFRHSSEGQVRSALASSGAGLCPLPDVLCRSGLKHADPPGSRETFCQ